MLEKKLSMKIVMVMVIVNHRFAFACVLITIRSGTVWNCRYADGDNSDGSLFIFCFFLMGLGPYPTVRARNIPIAICSFDSPSHI